MRRLEAEIYAERLLFDRPRCQYHPEACFGIAVEDKLGVYGPYVGALDAESLKSKKKQTKPEKLVGHEICVFLTDLQCAKL